METKISPAHDRGAYPGGLEVEPTAPTQGVFFYRLQSRFQGESHHSQTFPLMSRCP